MPNENASVCMRGRGAKTLSVAEKRDLLPQALVPRREILFFIYLFFTWVFVGIRGTDCFVDNKTQAAKSIKYKQPRTNYSTTRKSRKVSVPRKVTRLHNNTNVG